VTAFRRHNLAAHRLPRRELLRVGGLGLLGLSTSALEAGRAASAADRSPRANSCVFIFLFGGPSHVDLWDMKPLAPLEIRGDFQPVATNVPGIHLCEHLPLLAQQVDRFCLLRSMTHRMNVHGPACSEVYSGREYFGPPVTDQARPEDWPSLAAMVMRYMRSESGLPPSVVLPWYTQFVGQDRRIAGQTGGRMGEQWNPFLVQGNPGAADFDVQGIRLPADVGLPRFERRVQLLRRIEDVAPFRTPPPLATVLESNEETARRLIEKAQATNAFALNSEPDPLRDRYGRTSFGQSLLLARRLVESGIPLVTVNWDDDTKFDKVSPHWDTHHDNFKKLKNDLCPPFDRAFSGFLADLHDRGLLETTLVVALGEFGRTPKIGVITQNGMTQKSGRDHWPHAFTALIAGGGVRGGQAYGATNATGGYVAGKPVGPADLSATILQHLGVDPRLTYHDAFQRVDRVLSEGTPVTDLG
jgi:uncharacterized protein (DUF1501 family)